MLEDQAKAYLRSRSLPVPLGALAKTPQEAHAYTAAWQGRVAVKALVATGRRGKAGAVRICDDAGQAQEVAAKMLGTLVAGLPVNALYVEEGIDIKE
nr:hypothetical protein [Pseudomonas sp.]